VYKEGHLPSDSPLKIKVADKVEEPPKLKDVDFYFT